MATGTTAEQIIDVVTPAAGESVTEGTILEWHVKVGDAIKVDETIVEISTDKVDVELPAPASGTVTELLVAGGRHGHRRPGDRAHRRRRRRRREPAPTSGDGNGRRRANGSPARPTEEPHPRASRCRGVCRPAARPRRRIRGDGRTDRRRRHAGRRRVGHARARSSNGASSWATSSRPTTTIVEISTDKVDVELPAPASGTVSELLVDRGRHGDGRPGDRAHRRRRTRRRLAGAARRGQPRARRERRRESPQLRPAGGREGLAGRRPRGGGRGRRPGAASSGSGPAGRITKSDVLSAASAQRRGAAPPQTAGERRRGDDARPQTQLMRGSAAALARYMEQSRSIPTATSFRTLTVTVLDARRKELKAAGRKVSFTHLIAYAIARAADDMPVMANHFDRGRRQAPPRARRPGEPRPGGGRGEEGRHTHADGAGDPRRRAACRSSASSRPTTRWWRRRARTRSRPTTCVGGNMTLTNPGGIGTIASVPRLMTGQGTIVATGSIAYPPGLATSAR